MEFKFRAGEYPPSSYFPPPPPPSDGYFTAQALRAGYLRGDLYLRRPEPLPHHPFMPPREAIRRELEKERIREEIIAREIFRRRELEEEVRRELAMEREFELRRQADRFSLASSSALPERRGLGSALIRDRFAVTSRREAGAGERVLPVESEVRPLLQEVGKPQVVLLGKSTTAAVPTTVGTKRKAASISELKEWTCALCHVHATSERGLSEHFRGKKHRAKEEELKGSKGVKSQPARIPEKIVGQPKIVKKVANSAQNQNQKQKQIKKPLVVNQPADQSVPKNEVMAPKKGKFTFVCQQCKIKCYNEPTMVAHLSGKKHLTRVKELETISEGLTGNVTSFKVTGKCDGVAGGLGKELKIERESRRTVVEAEVAEALTDEEGQEIEGQMDDDIEPVDELEEEASFFKLHMRGSSTEGIELSVHSPPS